MEWVTKHKVATVALALLVLIVLGSVFGNKSSTTSASSHPPVTGSESASSTQVKRTTPTTKPMPGIGQPALSGNFQFTVKSVKCDVVRVGSGLLTDTAQGQYCLVSVQVENISKTSHSFDVTQSEYLYNSAGDRYSISLTATIDEAPPGYDIYPEINPGNSITAVWVFDIPKGQTPVVAKVSNGFLSSAVKINVANSVSG